MSRSAAERRSRALQLRLAGLPPAAIAARLGYPSAKAAAAASVRALTESVAAAQTADESIADLQVARYERIVTAHWSQSMSGKGFHTDRVIAALARIDRITGLESQRVEVIQPELTDRVQDLLDRILPRPTSGSTHDTAP